MIQFDDMREMERRASMFYGDGLLDIGIGIGLVILGFGMLFGLSAIAVVYMAMIFTIVKLAKRSITIPRMHHLDFLPEPDMESRLRRSKPAVAASLIALLFLGVLALFMSRMIPERISAGLRSNAIVIFGVLLAAIFMLIAWGTAMRRLRVQGGIAILALVLGHWFGLGVSWYLMFLGAVTGAVGAVVLARFIRDYPRFRNRSGKALQRTS